MTTGHVLYERAREIIPGGTQLLSKRPEMFLPEQWPNYYSRAKGAEVWDLDGNKYVDMSYNGIAACILGAADPDVNSAVKGAIDQGSMSTLNCPEEVELADLLCELHPWAEKVRFGRCGGEMMVVAVRIARAATGRDKVAFCGYHGWHDWYLAANLGSDAALDGHLLPGLDPAGVPRSLAGTSLPFRYNRLDDLETLVADHQGELAAIVMEPVRNYGPDPGFLESVRSIATQTGAVLIFDEITSGWRLATGGAHLVYGITPDMAVFSKAISNGYPMSAVIGVSSVMEAAQGSFISSTNWTEKIGPVAALATLGKHRQHDVSRRLIEVGRQVQDCWEEGARRAGLSITLGGIPPLTRFTFDYGNAQSIRTYFTQLLLERGFLATNAFYATYAHDDSHVAAYSEAVEEAFTTIAQALEREELDQRLKGPVAHAGFYRLA